MISIKTKKILVPVDFSKIADRAIRHAAFIAKRNKGEVILLHVQKKGDLLNIFLPAVKMNDASVVVEFLEKRLELIAEKIIGKYGIKVSSIVSMGNITSEIVDIANDSKADLIIMGTQGSDSNNDLFLGSNSYRLLTKTNIPVMTIRKDAPKLGYSNILLPIDSSEHSRQKVNAAIQIANQFGARLHVLGLLGSDDDNYEYKMRVILPQIKQLAKEKKLVCNTEIDRADNRAKKTLSYAKKIKADLIIIMTDQRAEFSSVILGTYAHQLLNDSRIPILSIPPEEQDIEVTMGGMWPAE